MRYSLLDRSIEKNGVLDTAKELGITIIAYSPLEQGILTGKFHEDPIKLKSIGGFRRFMSSFREKSLERTRPLVEALKQVAAQHNASAAQVALAWVIRRHGQSVVAIPGASSVSQVESNAAAMELDLSEDEIERLAGVAERIRA